MSNPRSLHRCPRRLPCLPPPPGARNQREGAVRGPGAQAAGRAGARCIRGGVPAADRHHRGRPQVSGCIAWGSCLGSPPCRQHAQIRHPCRARGARKPWRSGELTRHRAAPATHAAGSARSRAPRRWRSARSARRSFSRAPRCAARQQARQDAACGAPAKAKRAPPLLNPQTRYSSDCERAAWRARLTSHLQASATARKKAARGSWVVGFNKVLGCRETPQGNRRLRDRMRTPHAELLAWSQPPGSAPAAGLPEFQRPPPPLAPAGHGPEREPRARAPLRGRVPEDPGRDRWGSGPSEIADALKRLSSRRPAATRGAAWCLGSSLITHASAHVAAARVATRH